MDDTAARGYEQVLQEHRELRDLLRRIEQALDERSATIDEVGRLLGELGDRLVKHFALEEQGGYFAEALLHAPRLVERANELMDQHPKMARQACQLAEEARRGDGSQRWWDETRERFKAFLHEISYHEQNEDRLIQDAYTRDDGAAD